MSGRSVATATGTTTDTAGTAPTAAATDATTGASAAVSVDPLERRQFLRHLAELGAEHGARVMISSRLVRGFSIPLGYWDWDLDGGRLG